MQQGAPRIEGGARARENPCRRQVHDQTTEGDGKHRAAGHRLRRKEPAHRFDRDENHQGEQRQRIDERGQNLRARVAVGGPARRRTTRNPLREQREPERRRVGKHVPGVGEQRQRTGEPAPCGLDQRKSAGENEREGQCLPSQCIRA